MAAPQFVPVPPTHQPRDYQSPPRRDDSWWLDRPADLRDGQPDLDAGRMGAPGPDQGYVFTLLPLLRPEVHLQPGEDLAAVERGIVAVALKRASLFGRAPVIHDLRAAYAVWGFFEPKPAEVLVGERRTRFEGVHHTAAHYPELRALADAVPAEVLRETPEAILAAHRADWRSQLRF